jgi:hypothetical protein
MAASNWQLISKYQRAWAAGNQRNNIERNISGGNQRKAALAKIVVGGGEEYRKDEKGGSLGGDGVAGAISGS